MSEDRFILFDGRARMGDTDDATIFATAETEEECRELNGDFGDDAIWYEVGENGEMDMREDLSPALPSYSGGGRRKRRKRI